MNELSLQERYAPDGICFGCGPANGQGLQLRSFARGAEVIAEWRPQKHHEAFPGILCGGIIGSLLDCHGNWTAAWHFLERDGLGTPPCTVTAEYSVKLLRPTPTDGQVRLIAHVIESSADRAVVEGQLFAAEKLRAVCRGIFVAVEPGHPAYHAR